VPGGEPLTYILIERTVTNLLRYQGYAKTLTGFDDLKDSIRHVARLTSQRARALGLALTVLDAFEGYEGLIDRKKHAEKVEFFRFWVEICGILGIEYIQIPATFEPKEVATGEEMVIVEDLRIVADIGLSVTPSVKVGSETVLGAKGTC